MTIPIYDSSFDVAVVAGPRITAWPSIGVRSLSSLCTDAGLKVGLLGGSDLQGKGVIPLAGAGAIVLVEDQQRRVHRLKSRAVVKVTAPLNLPDPFPGWRSQGLLPLATAVRLKNESKVRWEPSVVILGTGNRAFRFGSELLETRQAREVICIEVQKKTKNQPRFFGWEVEHRRFTILGGKTLRATPLGLTRRSPLLWELRIRDSLGVQILTTSRVIAAGPFEASEGIREYPPGSFLFEFEQRAAMTREEDVEGWVIEENSGRWLGSKISKALQVHIGDRKGMVDREHRRSKSHLKKASEYQRSPFSWQYDGKWVDAGTMEKLKAFPGVPQRASSFTASIECFEEIVCDECQRACPEQAIQIHRSSKTPQFLVEDRCTGCGVCMVACPSSTPVMVSENEDRQEAQLTLRLNESERLKEGSLVQLLNRQSQPLGSARVVHSKKIDGFSGSLVDLQIPSHLVWEARGFRPKRMSERDDETYMTGLYEDGGVAPVEIVLDGEKRLVHPNLAVSMALFEIGQARAEDTLLCPDGSCGQCEIELDGQKHLACQSQTREGMVVRMPASAALSEESLCPCLGVTSEEVIDRVKTGNLRSPEAVLSVTRVGEGKCRGQFCMDAFKRLLAESGIDTKGWIDWRFPWSEWRIHPGPNIPNIQTGL